MQQPTSRQRTKKRQSHHLEGEGSPVGRLQLVGQGLVLSLSLSLARDGSCNPLRWSRCAVLDRAGAEFGLKISVFSKVSSQISSSSSNLCARAPPRHCSSTPASASGATAIWLQTTPVHRPPYSPALPPPGLKVEIKPGHTQAQINEAILAQASARGAHPRERMGACEHRVRTRAAKSFSRCALSSTAPRLSIRPWTQPSQPGEPQRASGSQPKPKFRMPKPLLFAPKGP